MNPILEIDADGLSVRVSLQGGTIVDALCNGAPLFRPYNGNGTGPIDPLKCASFPFVPFGNRVENNRFSYAGKAYSLEPNTDWDRHYLHGDGWLRDWTLASHSESDVTIELQYGLSEETPYAYEARQSIRVEDGALHLGLGVCNTGDLTLPFGVGHHLFFPLTKRMTLEAEARRYVTEKDEYLPDRVTEIPAELDFSEPKLLPRRWINNGFEGWNGRARINWPENGRSALIKADAVFSTYFLFHSDTTFEPDFADDYFCFEPMTHTANGHNRPDLGGLVALLPNQALETEIRIFPTGF